MTHSQAAANKGTCVSVGLRTGWTLTALWDSSHEPLLCLAGGGDRLHLAPSFISSLNHFMAGHEYIYPFSPISNYIFITWCVDEHQSKAMMAGNQRRFLIFLYYYYYYLYDLWCVASGQPPPSNIFSTLIEVRIFFNVVRWDSQHQQEAQHRARRFIHSRSKLFRFPSVYFPLRPSTSYC